MKKQIIVISLLFNCLSFVQAQTLNQTNTNGTNIGHDQINYYINDNSKSNTTPATNPSGSIEATNPKCKEQDFGDFCFVNSKPYEIDLVLIAVHKKDGLLSYSARLSIPANGSQCSYMLPADVYDYTYTQGEQALGKAQSRGQILVEQCKSKELVIR